MPMPNFHVVHLKPFDEFDPSTVRTEYGGTVFGVVMPEDVWVRFAWHIAREEELPFSIGFPANKYSVEEIANFLDESKIPYIEIIEAAKGESQSRMLSLEIKKVDAQDSFVVCRGTGQARKLGFTGIARTDQPVMGPDGTPEYDDIRTLRIPSLTLPLDYAHNFDVIVGRVNAVRRRSGKLYIRGEVISSRPGDKADEIIDDLLAGKPLQLSIFAVGDGRSAVRTLVEEDGVHQVPCRIYENFILRGVAICGYGADGNTKIQPDKEGAKEMPPEELPQAEPVESEARCLSQEEPHQDGQPGAEEQQVEPSAELLALLQNKMTTLEEKIARLEQALTDLGEATQQLRTETQDFLKKLEEQEVRLNELAADVEESRFPLPSFKPAGAGPEKSPKERTLDFFASVARKFGLKPNIR